MLSLVRLCHRLGRQLCLPMLHSHRRGRWAVRDASDDSSGARAGGELVVSRSAMVWSIVQSRAGGQSITGGSPDLSGSATASHHDGELDAVRERVNCEMASVVSPD